MMHFRGMANTHHFKLRSQLSVDEAGVVFQAQDQSGRRVELRKFTRHPTSGKGLESVEEVAYQVAVGRLDNISHPSLRRISFGGCDPLDGSPYVATKPVDGPTLGERLAQGPLEVEMATLLLSQLLELCELVSHCLADEGVWVETQPSNIHIRSAGPQARFVFWPSPVRALSGNDTSPDLSRIIQLTEAVIETRNTNADGEECGHLQAWLQWLREAAGGEGTTIREAREMLAAAAGVEPPPPVEVLLQASKQPHKPLTNWSRLLGALKVPAPKMPLFALLSVMLVGQAILGWLWVRKINENIDARLRNLKESIYDSPYTVERDPARAAERGSQPVEFD